MPSALWDTLDDSLVLWKVREHGAWVLTDREFARYLILRLSWPK